MFGENIEEETVKLHLVSNELSRLEEEIMRTKISIDTSQFASQYSLQKLVTIEKRMTMAREAAKARTEYLSSQETVPDPASQAFLSSSVPPGWQRGLTENMIPFFCHHDSESTQWDHPGMVTTVLYRSSD